MAEEKINRSLPSAAEPGTAEAERIRGYLQSQAARMSLAELVDKVRQDMLQVKPALNAVVTARYDVRPCADDWSANEVANHLVETSRGVAAGIRQVLDGGDAPSGVIDRMGASREILTADAWWALLRTDREAILDRVAEASGDEFLDVKWPHRVFGDLNWREWLLFMRVHDLDHARQLLNVADAVNS